MKKLLQWNELKKAEQLAGSADAHVRDHFAFASIERVARLCDLGNLLLLCKMRRRTQ